MERITEIKAQLIELALEGRDAADREDIARCMEIAVPTQALMKELVTLLDDDDPLKSGFMASIKEGERLQAKYAN